MKHKQMTVFSLTRKTMHGYIGAGRRAIEYSLLLILVQPRTLNAEDDTEMAELKALLKTYNKLLAKYEIPRIGSVRVEEEKTVRGGSK